MSLLPFFVCFLYSHSGFHLVNYNNLDTNLIGAVCNCIISINMGHMVDTAVTNVMPQHRLRVLKGKVQLHAFD